MSFLLQVIFQLTTCSMIFAMAEQCKFINDTVFDCSGNKLKDIYVTFPLCIEELYLNRNEIENVRDLRFSKLAMLKVLDLSVNNISELETKAFSGLKWLQTLNLQGNSLDDFSDELFEPLENLEILILAANYILKIPQTIIHLKKLKLLNLNSNKIVQIDFPYGMEKIHLQHLLLNNNKIKSITESSNKTETKLMSSSRIHLQHLLLNNNKVKNITESSNKTETKLMSSSISLFNLSLTSLDISFNPLEMYVIKKVIKYVECNNITDLNIDGLNLFSEKIFNLSSNSLLHLSISHNNFTSIDCNMFTKLINLQTLNITFNKLVNVNFLSPLIMLKNLNLSNNHLKHIPSDLPASIEILDLSHNLIEIMENQFSHIKDLKYLNMKNNMLEFVKDNFFYNLNSLEYLDLSFNTINLNRKYSFSHFINLKFLNLENNNCTTLISFEGLINLEILKLSRNHLKEAIENFEQFPSLPNLHYLDLEGNNLSAIPLRLFSFLPKVKHLSLAHNSLTQFSLELFTPLENLEILDLSHNFLSSVNSLSTITSALSNLKIFNLTANHFFCTEDNKNYLQKNFYLNVLSNDYICELSESWSIANVRTFLLTFSVLIYSCGKYFFGERIQSAGRLFTSLPIIQILIYLWKNYFVRLILLRFASIWSCLWEKFQKLKQNVIENGIRLKLFSSEKLVDLINPDANVNILNLREQNILDEVNAEINAQQNKTATILNPFKINNEGIFDSLPQMFNEQKVSSDQDNDNMAHGKYLDEEQNIKEIINLMPFSVNEQISPLLKHKNGSSKNQLEFGTTNQNSWLTNLSNECTSVKDVLDVGSNVEQCRSKNIDFLTSPLDCMLKVNKDEKNELISILDPLPAFDGKLSSELEDKNITREIDISLEDTKKKPDIFNMELQEFVSILCNEKKKSNQKDLLEVNESNKETFDVFISCCKEDLSWFQNILKPTFNAYEGPKYKKHILHSNYDNSSDINNLLNKSRKAVIIWSDAYQNSQERQIDLVETIQKKKKTNDIIVILKNTALTDDEIISNCFSKTNIIPYWSCNNSTFWDSFYTTLDL